MQQIHDARAPALPFNAQRARLPPVRYFFNDDANSARACRSHAVPTPASWPMSLHGRMGKVSSISAPNFTWGGDGDGDCDCDGDCDNDGDGDGRRSKVRDVLCA